MIQLHFLTQPSLTPAITRALFLNRRGYRTGSAWPQIEGQLGPVNLVPEILQNYLRVCQLPPSSELPILYPHVLSSRLHMHVLTHRSFPLRLLGAVHLRNKITQHQPMALDSKLLFKVDLLSPIVTSKGIEFDFETKAYKDDLLVWESLTTYYKAGRFGKVSSENSPVVMSNLEQTQEVAQWYLAKNLGKAYARVCNDYNPIHLSKIMAKLFGFKRDVAHGMGVLATALSKVEKKDSTYPKINEVIFKGPLFLENNVRVVSGEQPGRYDIYCGKNNRPSICFTTNNTSSA